MDERHLSGSSDKLSVSHRPQNCLPLIPLIADFQCRKPRADPESHATRPKASTTPASCGKRRDAAGWKRNHGVSENEHV